MIIAMLLAHLTGDYVLQWDALARWKGASVKGAACWSKDTVAACSDWVTALPAAAVLGKSNMLVMM